MKSKRTFAEKIRYYKRYLPLYLMMLPALIYRRWSLEGDRIVSRDVSGTLPVVQVGVVWRKGAPLSAPAREFIRAAQSQSAQR